MKALRQADAAATADTTAASTDLTAKTLRLNETAVFCALMFAVELACVEHHAMADVLSAIASLRYAKNNVFSSQSVKRDKRVRESAKESERVGGTE